MIEQTRKIWITLTVTKAQQSAHIMYIYWEMLFCQCNNTQMGNFLMVIPLWWHSGFLLSIQMELFGNPWQCDVRLSWICRGKSYGKSLKVFKSMRLIGQKALMCAGPPSLRGLAISDLSEYHSDYWSLKKVKHWEVIKHALVIIFW